MSRGIAIARIAAAPIAIAIAYVAADQSASRSARHPERGRPVAEQPGDERVGGREQHEVPQRERRRPAAPSPPARPPGTSVAAPVNATNATSSVATRTSERSSVGQAPVRGDDPLLEAERPVDEERRRGERGHEPDPDRDEVDRAEAADRRDGRQDQRLDRDAVLRRRARRAWPSTWSAPSSVAASSSPATSHVSGPSSRPGQPDDRDDDERQVAPGGRDLAGERSGSRRGW